MSCHDIFMEGSPGGAVVQNGRKLCSMQSPMIPVSRYAENVLDIDSWLELVGVN